METITLTYEDLNEAIRSTRDFLPMPTSIIGISRGGLIPAVMLSSKWGIPLEIVKASSYTTDCVQGPLSIDFLFEPDPSQSYLLVDDIADTGETLHGIHNALIAKGCTDVRSWVFVFKKKRSGYEPDLAWKIVEEPSWIIFPWEV